MKFIYMIYLGLNSRPHQGMLMSFPSSYTTFFGNLYATFYFIFLTMKPLKDPKIDTSFLFQRLLK
jgi:hypothetical protein